MTARETFTIGQRVQQSHSPVWTRQHKTTARTGVVEGFGRTAVLVRIRRDGTRIAVTYHMDAWEPVQP